MPEIKLNLRPNLLRLFRYLSAIILNYLNQFRKRSNKGVCLDKLGQFQEAIKNFDLAIKYNPNDAEAYYNKGFYLGKLGQLQKAIENFDLAIKYKPDLAVSYVYKGVCLHDLGQFQEAIESCNLAIKYDTNNVKAYQLINIFKQNAGIKK
ncbi:TPR repeat-containing protein 03 [Orientia tsutsugamushi]|uniref:TPR repeat-containing protein 03 n=1 Tax=Orientia tsutsugamushi TaxID=784 RepID=A0A2U3RPV4_ORITS|nr:TPR repeat-containing protein 03 [Orientia tsutsugamushi]